MKNQSILSELLKLLFLMQTDISVTEYLKSNNYYSRIYSLISEVLHFSIFTQIDLMFLMNILVNISTESVFYYTIERYLFYGFFSNQNDHQQLIPLILTELEEKYKGLIKYIIIKNPHYLEMVFLSFYELKFDESLKSFYFFLFNEMVISSTYNAQLFAKETFVEKLSIMLRIEINYNLKVLITNFLTNILREHMDIARLKCLILTMRYNYYWNDVFCLFPKLKEDQLKTNFFEFENFQVSLKLLFSVMQKIITS